VHAQGANEPGHAPWAIDFGGLATRSELARTRKSLFFICFAVRAPAGIPVAM
jgi:hypothetical protein